MKRYFVLFTFVFFANTYGDLKVNFLHSLYECGAVREGNYNWRNIKSPFNVDMKSIMSRPAIFAHAIELVSEKVKNCSFDLLCAVPWAPVPLVGALAAQLRLPMIMVRKAIQPDTNQKMVEGVFKKGQKVLLIEDCSGSGISVQDTVHILERAGLQVSDIIVLFDFEHGVYEKFARQGIRVHSIAHLSELIVALQKHAEVSREFIKKIIQFRDKTRYCFR